MSAHARRPGAAAAKVLGLQVVLAVALLSGCPDDGPAAEVDAGPPPIAWMVELQGPVTLERGGQRFGGAKNLPLISGDVVSTGRGATVLVRYVDSQEVEVAESTRFRLIATPTQLSVDLEEGHIVTRGGDAGVRRLAVRAPGTSLDVEMGDVIDITAQGASSRLTVTEGDIILLGPDGGTVSMAKGESFEMGEIQLATPPPPTTEAIALKLTAERGKVMLKGKGQKRFAAAGKGEQAVADGTAFQIPKAGRAVVLSSTGVRAQLNAASGRLEAAVREGMVEKYTMGLEQGEVQLQFPGGAQRKLSVKGGGKTLELLVSEPTTATIVASKKGPRLVVVAGSATVGTSAVKAGQAMDLASGAKVVSLPRPPLLLPARRVRVFADAMPTVGLSVPEAAESIQVATDSAFTQLLAQGKVEGSYLPFTPPNQGELHWRGLGKDGAPVGKGQARFDQDPDDSADDIEHPRAEVAETGLKAVVYFQSALPELTFVFPARDDAAGYRLRVYKADDLKNAIWQREEKDTRSTATAGQIGEGQYLWYAAALNAAGAEIGGGRMNKLELVYDNSRRSLAIARPRQGERVGATVDASGVAPIGSKLFVNGHAASLDGKGRFKAKVPGAPYLVFRLVTDDGAESYWVRQVRSR